MKIYATLTLAILGLVLFADQGFAYEPNKSGWKFRAGPKMHNQGYYLVPNKQQIRNIIRFCFFRHFTNNWSDFYALANILPSRIRNENYCYTAEDWRYTTLNKNNTFILVFAWTNLTVNNLGWVALQHSHDGWYITSNQRMQWYPMKGYTIGDEINFEWLSNGVPIKIDIRNPYDENGWTENDIWYKFSFN